MLKTILTLGLLLLASPAIAEDPTEFCKALTVVNDKIYQLRDSGVDKQNATVYVSTLLADSPEQLSLIILSNLENIYDNPEISQEVFNIITFDNCMKVF